MTPNKREFDQLRETEKILLVPEPGEQNVVPPKERNVVSSEEQDVAPPEEKSMGQAQEPSVPALFDDVGMTQPVQKFAQDNSASSKPYDPHSFEPWKKRRAKEKAGKGLSKSFVRFAVALTLLAPCAAVMLAFSRVPQSGSIVKMRVGMMTGLNSVAIEGCKEYWKGNAAGASGTMLSLANERAERNKQSAVILYNEAIQANPNSAVAWLARGWNYSNLQQKSKALSDFDHALSINPNYAMAYNDKGCVYLDEGKFDLAMKYFNKALAINPHVWNYPLDRAIVLARTGQKDQALKELDKASLYADSAAAWNTIKYWRDFANEKP